MNRIANKGQLWLSPTLTENAFHFLLRIQTRLSLRLYKDWMACSNGPSTPNSMIAYPPVPFFKTIPDLHAAFKKHFSKDSPTMSRAFSISGRISSTPVTLPLWTFLKYLRDHNVLSPWRTCWSGSGVPESGLSTAQHYPQSAWSLLTKAV